MQRGFPPELVPRRRSLLSTGAAARVASCHRTTILRAILSGELPAVRLGPNGNHRIADDDLDQWMIAAGPDNEEDV